MEQARNRDVGNDESAALTLTENIPVGTYASHLGPDGVLRFTFMSRRFLAMLGLTRAQAEADPQVVFRRAHPDEYETFMRRNAEVMAARSDFRWEGRLLIDGEVSWVYVESVARPSPDGGTVWEGVMTDITVRKLTEARLESERRETARMLEHLPVPLMALSLTDDRVLYVNSPFERTFGYSRAEIATVDAWAQRAYPDDSLRAALRQAWEIEVARAAAGDGQVAAREVAVTCKDGRLVDVVISGQVLEDRLLVSFLDITSRKQAEAEREQLISQLQTALGEIRTLRGLIPMCAGCKRIRDDDGYWHGVEAYVSSHTHAQFSHGLCSACFERYYPGMREEMERDVSGG